MANTLSNLLKLDLVIGYGLTDDRSLTYKLTDIGRAVAGRFQALVQQKKEHDEKNSC